MTDEAQLAASVDLSIDAALTNVQTLGTAVDDALGQASQQASDALANATAVAPAITVEADTTEAEASIAKLAEDADAVKPVIAVDADTGGAEQALSELSGAAEDAGGSLDTARESAHGFGIEAGVIGGLTEAATGHVGGLSEVVGGLEGVSGGAVAGVAALGAGVGELIHEGIGAESAIQRFNTIVGDMKDRVEHIDIGSLSTSMKELGIQFGSTDAEMKNATASLFQFATNSGASREASADFASKIEALAARAVALNPALGNVADVAENMGVRISRGGRFATQFGLALTAAEINARALGETGKTTASDLTIYEKAQAAADIAAERYGGTLGKTVADGAKNAANEQKSLTAELKEMLEAAGRPLVGGFMDAFRAALPDVKELAASLGQFGAAVLPLVVSALKDVQPILSLLTDLITGFSDAFDGLGAKAEVTGALIGFAFGGPLGALIGGAVGFFSDLTQAIGDTAQSTADFRAETDKLVASLKDVPQSVALAKVVESVTIGGKEGIVNLDAFITRIRQISAESPTLAKKLVDGFREAGGMLVLTKKQSEELQQALSGGESQFKNTAKAAHDVAAGDQAIKDSATGAAGAVTTQAGATDSATQAAIGFVSALQKQDEIQNRLINEQLGLTGATINYRQAILDQKKAQDDYNAALASGDPKKIADAELNKQQADLRVAESTIALGKAQQDLNVDLNDPTATDAAIRHLRDLQAQYPETASALQPFIDKIVEEQNQHKLAAFLAGIHAAQVAEFGGTLEHVNGIPNPQKYVAFDFAGDDALTQLDHLVQTLQLLGFHPDLTQQELTVALVTNVPNVAEGGVFMPKRGGTQINVAEAGFAEAVVSAGNTAEENWALLQRAGIPLPTALPLPTAPIGAAYAGIAPTSHQVHTDESIHIGTIDASGQPDPLRTALAVASRLRIEKWMATP